MTAEHGCGDEKPHNNESNRQKPSEGLLKDLFHSISFPEYLELQKRGTRDEQVTIQIKIAPASPPLGGAYAERNISFSTLSSKFEAWFRNATLQDALDRYLINLIPFESKWEELTAQEIHGIADLLLDLEYKPFHEKTFVCLLIRACKAMTRSRSGSVFKKDGLLLLLLVATSYYRRAYPRNHEILSFILQSNPIHVVCLNFIDYALECKCLIQASASDSRLLQVGESAEALLEEEEILKFKVKVQKPSDQEKVKSAPTTLDNNPDPNASRSSERSEVLYKGKTNQDLQAGPQVKSAETHPPWYRPDMPGRHLDLLQALERFPIGANSRQLKDLLQWTDPSSLFTARYDPEDVNHLNIWIERRRNFYRLRSAQEVGGK
ncbi:MAG: hypothetical protein HS116_00370 [Planctomycetes bacterium]|nr:hypothetical protein [Planctomycetota bacterium]